MEIKEKVATFFEGYVKQTQKKGHILIHPDNAVAFVYYLLDGNVVQYDISPVGNEIIVNAFKPGAFFPLSNAINHNENLYYFEAATDVTYRRAPAHEVVAFLQNNPDVTFDVLSRVYRGTDGLLRRTAHLMGGNAKSRLVFELLNATARFGQNKADHIFIPLSESDIARRSGLTRETVSRAMKELKVAQIIGVEQRGITVFDKKRLEEVIGSEL